MKWILANPTPKNVFQVHRRLLTDDGFGLEETLNEEAYGVGLVVKGKHRILFGNFRQEGKKD